MPRTDTVEEYVDRTKQLKDAFGIKDQYFDDERKALKEEREEIAKRRKGLIPDAMIRAGLGIAAGQDQNFLTNVAAGATPAFEQFVKDDDSLDNEEKLLRKENRTIDKMMRAEAIGDMSEYRRYETDLKNTQLKVLELFYDNKAKMISAGVDADTAEADVREKAMKAAQEQIESRYDTKNALLAYFSEDKDKYDAEFIKLFKRNYKTFTGNDFEGAITAVNPEGIYNPADDSSNVTVPPTEVFDPNDLDPFNLDD